MRNDILHKNTEFFSNYYVTGVTLFVPASGPFTAILMPQMQDGLRNLQKCEELCVCNIVKNASI